MPEIFDLGRGVARVTHPLPWALDHVHCYVVDDGDGVTIIDAGLGDERTAAGWRAALEQLGSPRVHRLVISHFHPDHIGAAAALVELTGAEQVVQGELDARISAAVWDPDAPLEPYTRYLSVHGMPDDLAERSVAADMRTPVSIVAPTQTLVEGDRIVLGGEEFEVLVLPGHADGHIVLVGEDTGRMFGGDLLLAEITPNVGRWPETAPDPLGAYLHSLERITAADPTVVYPGHGPVITKARARAAEIAEHHAERLDVHAQALRDGAETSYEVAQVVWPGDTLTFHEQRFALVEAISHLERLVADGRAESPQEGRWRPV